MPSWRRSASGQIRKGPHSSPQITIVRADAFEPLASAPAAPALQVLYKQGVPKAWVYFTVSAGSVTVAASFNVSSVIRNSVGNFTINFAAALTDANYVAEALSNNIPMTFAPSGGTKTASAFQIICWNTGFSPADPNSTMISVLGN